MDQGGAMKLITATIAERVGVFIYWVSLAESAGAAT
jgi:hypothetical protein